MQRGLSLFRAAEKSSRKEQPKRAAVAQMSLACASACAVEAASLSGCTAPGPALCWRHSFVKVLGVVNRGIKGWSRKTLAGVDVSMGIARYISPPPLVADCWSPITGISTAPPHHHGDGALALGEEAKDQLVQIIQRLEPRLNGTTVGRSPKTSWQATSEPRG